MIKTIRIPISIELIHGDGYHLFINVQIKGQNLRCLIDTGASKTVVGEQHIHLLTKSNLNDDTESMAKGLGTEVLESTIYELHDLAINHQPLPSLLVGTLNLGAVSETYKQIGIKPFDIILGSDLLLMCKATISYSKSRLFLRV